MSGRGRSRQAAHFRPYGRPGPIIEQKLATQNLEIQRLLTENQRFAATHVALRRDLGTAQQEALQLSQLLTEKDARVLALEAQLEQMNQELHCCRVEAQQMSVVRAENEALRQEVQRNRTSGSSSKNHPGDKGKSYETGGTASSTPSSGYSTPTSTTTGGTTDNNNNNNWSVHYAANGVPYYYNAVTGVTQWERPGALDGTQSQAALVQQASAFMQQFVHAYNYPSQAQTVQPVVPHLAGPQAHHVLPPYGAAAAGGTSATGNPSLACSTPVSQSIPTLTRGQLTYLPAPRQPAPGQ